MVWSPHFARSGLNWPDRPVDDYLFLTAAAARLDSMLDIVDLLLAAAVCVVFKLYFVGEGARSKHFVVLCLRCRGAIAKGLRVEVQRISS